MEKNTELAQLFYHSNIDNINLMIYSKIYSNKQGILFKIISINNDNTFNIKFENDNTIIKFINKKDIYFGLVKNPNITNNKRISYTKIYNLYHHLYNLCLMFNTRKELRFKYPSQYATIIRNKWYDIFDNFTYLNEKNKHSYENCQKAIDLCENFLEFRTKFQKEYKTAWNNGWLDEISNHLEKSKHFYTKEECYEKALLFEYAVDFRNNYYNYYRAALNNGWLDEISIHFKNNNKYEFDRIIYVYEFEDGSAYIGLTKNFEKRHYYRKYYLYDGVTNHINNTNLIPKIKFLTDYINAKEAQIKEQEYIELYRNNGWNILNKIKGGHL